jgi:hypothetical protein
MTDEPTASVWDEVSALLDRYDASLRIEGKTRSPGPGSCG